MSDEWYEALRNRKGHLEAALEDIDNAESDVFLAAGHVDRLDSAKDQIKTVLDETESEIEFCEKDWDTIESHADDIAKHILSIVDEFAEAGVLTYEERPHGGLDIDWQDDGVMDGEDWFSTDLAELLTRYHDWVVIRNEASDMADATGGGY